jgi:hypothetical protein
VSFHQKGFWVSASFMPQLFSIKPEGAAEGVLDLEHNERITSRLLIGMDPVSARVALGGAIVIAAASVAAVGCVSPIPNPGAAHVNAASTVYPGTTVEELREGEEPVRGEVRRLPSALPSEPPRAGALARLGLGDARAGPRSARRTRR